MYGTPSDWGTGITSMQYKENCLYFMGRLNKEHDDNV